MSDLGKARRIARIFNRDTKRTIIVPLDDALISGPSNGLANQREKLTEILEGKPDAVLAFEGLFKRNCKQTSYTGSILNLTASTIRSTHTRKMLISTVDNATALGMDAVAVHVNLGSKYENEMLESFGKISSQCQVKGMPLFAIMYIRTERNGGDYNYDDEYVYDRELYTEMVMHAGRVGAELGADILKLQFTGTVDTFRSVVRSCAGVPVVVSGGPKLPVKEMLSKAYMAIQAGAVGVCFGRNVFDSQDSTNRVVALRKIVHENYTVEEAIAESGVGVQPTADLVANTQWF